MSETGKVLFVDDDSQLRLVVAAHLKNAGFDVRTAENGHEAIDIAVTYQPDVIVMDCAMPVMDGMEATTQLKALPATEKIPIIILTGDHRTENLVLVLEAGAQEYVLKPFAMEELIARVRSMHRLAVTGRALDNLANRLTEENNCKTHRLQLLYDFAKQLNKASTLNEVLDLIIPCAQGATNANRISVLLRDDNDDRYLVCRRAIGIPADLVERIRITAIEGIAGQVYTTGKMMKAEALDMGVSGNVRGYAADAFVCTPLVLNSDRYGREVLGVLNITEKAGGQPFGDEEVACIQSLADSAAIAIHNHYTRTRLERSVHVLLMTVGRLAEFRDEETAGHLERVQEYVRLLGEQLAKNEKCSAVLTPEYIENLFLAAPLHDIGKVGIPDDILTKEGPLTKREFQVMQTHTTIGRQTLELAQEQTGHTPLLQMCIDIAHCHHEKYDGSGYPQGLSNSAIPLPARIIALADAYDAVTSRRRYKDPVPHNTAVKLLRAETGQHFDPDVVAAFEGCLGQFDHIRHERGAASEFAPEPVAAGSV